ncbi:hypothetical protein F5Y14DRAFT_458266 [Nemania sp. NC0429]|nr:hypothetical protein F5Y14DRAFT_458266 [Nemania sp. NC0429]
MPPQGDEAAGPVEVGQLEPLEYARKAAITVGEDDPTYLRVVNNFVRVSAIKHTSIGYTVYTDEAISLAIEALGRRRNRDSELSGNLAILFTARYQITRNIKDIENAITNMFQAIRETPGGNLEELSARLSNMANMVAQKYERTGSKHDVKDLVGYAQTAVSKTPEGSRSLSGRLSICSKALLTQYERIGEPDTLEEAITVARRSLDLTRAGKTGLVGKEASNSVKVTPPLTGHPLTGHL